MKKESEKVNKVEIGREVVCPIMSIGKMAGTPCIKHNCEFWVELSYGKQQVGRCTFAYLPVLLVETRQTLERFNGKEKK